ncbi:EAL domain-containing protein [Mycoplasmatota bacterium WC44]
MKKSIHEVKIRRYLRNMVALMIIYMGIFSYIIINRNYSNQELWDYEKISDEVSQTVYTMDTVSDYLSLNVKEYVVTGDTLYLDNYNQEVYINKDISRSVDLISEIELLSSAKVNLEKALSYLDELSIYELKAIDYMENGEQEEAIKMVFSNNYSEYKKIICDSIEKFETESLLIISNQLDNTNDVLFLYTSFTYIAAFSFLILILSISHNIYVFQRRTMRKILVDPLTKVGNHQALIDLISRDHNRQYICIVVDLFDFKLVNETYGHKNGDNALVQIAKRLVKVYSRKAIYRISGNRLVILTKKSVQERTLQDLISLVNVPVKNQLYNGDIVIDCSIGVAGNNLNIDNIEKLIDIASVASFISRSKHKNTYTFATKDTISEFTKHGSMKEKLDASVGNGMIFPEYQMIINPNNETVVGMASLSRWNKDGEILCSEEFYEFANKVGLQHDVDITIFNNSIKHLSKLKEKGLVPNDFFVSMSFSCLSLLRLDVCESLNLFEILNLEPSNVQLVLSNEVVESDYLMDIIRELKELGFRIVVESLDFNLSRINGLANINLGIKDVLKYTLGENKFFYEMLLDLTSKLDLNILVKGTGKPEELTTAMQFKNVNVQGFYYSKPLEIESFEKLLDKINKGIIKFKLNH